MLNRNVLFHPAPRPMPRTPDRRQRFKGLFMGGTARTRQPRQPRPSPSAPSQARAVPPTTSSPPPQHTPQPPPMQPTQSPHQSPRQSPPQQPPPQQSVAPQVLNVQNVANTCYAVSTIQVLHAIGLQQQLLAGQSPMEMNLTNLLTQVLSGTSPNSDLVPLVMAVNMCLPTQHMFTLGQQQCAGEFLSSLLNSLQLRPFFSTFLEEAICPLCRTTQSSNLPNSTTPFLLVIPVLISSVPVNLAALVTGALSQQGNFLSCQNVACLANLTQIPSTTQATEHAVTVYWLGRNISQGGVPLKSLTAMQEPDPNNWNGRQCTAVLAHEGRMPGGGHWIAFIRENGVWWRVDSSHRSPSIENPFLNQMNPGSTIGYTIDILFFS